jgi:hypothetical protein
MRVTQKDEDNENNILLRPRLMKCNSMAYINMSIKDKPKLDIPKLNFHNLHYSTRVSSVSPTKNQNQRRD